MYMSHVPAAVHPSPRPADAILIVDDEASVLYVLRHVARSLGVVSAEAPDAVTARELIAQREFAGALIDKNLPGESGLQLLRWLRAQQPDCLAIIMTAYANLDSTVEALRLGAFDYILKPFDIDSLEHRLRLALEHRRALAERAKMQSLLVQSDRMAALGLLAASVVHEVNNPLTTVLANLEFIEAETRRARAQVAELPVPEEARPELVRATARLAGLEDVLAETREGAERMRAIVRDIKTFARGDDPRSMPVDLRAVLESTLKMASAHTRNRAQVVRDFGDAPLVEGSESRLAQVFLNLVVNAAQAIPEGAAGDNEIRVRLRTGRQHEAVVEVSDTGNGIAPEHLPRIFDPLFSTKSTGEGTGLGLSICASIVESLGGRIEVESKVGRGTLFRVILPPALDALRALP